jgi:release factor glutamine methyltransferase
MENIFDKQRRSIYYELKQIGLEQQECWAEANLILEHVTGIKRTQQVIMDLDHFKADWVHEITRIINSRRQRMPLAYCLSEVEFARLAFKIIPGVLIPRPDTEALVEAIINRLCRGGIYSKHSVGYASSVPPASQHPTVESHVYAYIAEIGVGCGAIIISLLKRLPECTAWGCDTSEVAIATTLGNARRHDVHERLTLVHGDWEKVLPHDFNVIVSNPPYLPLSLQEDMQPEISFEPKSALFDGSEDGLSFYRQFAEKLPAHFAGRCNPLIRNMGSVNLAPTQASPLQENEGFAAFEIGDKQEQPVLDIFKQSGWQNLSISHDINGLPRVLTASPPCPSPPRG